MMNCLIFCALFSLSSSLAFKVSFHTVDVKKFIYEHVPVLVCTPHTFIYHRGDRFKMYLQLADNSTTAVAVVKNATGDTYLTRLFWPEGHPINFYPEFNKITIDVELSVNGSCVRERIVEGREVSTTAQNATAFKYNDICIKENVCLVLVGPSKECTDAKLPPLPCEHKSYRTPTTTITKDVVPDVLHSKTPDVLHSKTPDVQHSKTPDVLHSKTANETKNNPETSRAKDDSKEGAANTYFVIMIGTSITAAVALILLIIFATRQRCCIKHLPSVAQISPTNQDPFYENVHFRTERQQEELEREHVYDMVPAERGHGEAYKSNSTKGLKR